MICYKLPRLLQIIIVDFPRNGKDIFRGFLERMKGPRDW